MVVTNRPASQAGPEFGLVAGIRLSFVVLLALIWYPFLRYSASVTGSGTGPKASLPILLGGDGARIAYVALGAGIALLYIGVAALGARASQSAGERPWRTGAMLALIGGGVWLTLSVVMKFFPLLEPLSALSALLILVLPALAVLLAAQRTGDLATGALAGFWWGVTQAALPGILVIALDHLFVSVLLRTSWARDHLCAAHTGDALAACEMSDDLGFVATMLVLMPPLGWLFSLVGGAFGLALRSGATAATPAVTPDDQPFACARALLWRAGGDHYRGVDLELVVIMRLVRPLTHTGIRIRLD
jgi:hypothetical protein